MNTDLLYSNSALHSTVLRSSTSSPCVLNFSNHHHFFIKSLVAWNLFTNKDFNKIFSLCV